jgi:hypothetical protein
LANGDSVEPYLAERVRSELARLACELDVTVLVLAEAACAVLSGRVATAERRAQVEWIARGLLPSYEVQNCITVHAMEPPGREELA